MPTGKYVRTTEHRKKLSDDAKARGLGTKKGDKLSIEHRQAIANGHRGMKFSKQHKFNIAEARRKKGSTLTEEGRKRLKEKSLLNAQNPEWRKKCLAPNGALTRYGMGGEPAPTMLEFAKILCPLGYQMDTIKILVPGITRYILDFALLPEKINIEIDGKRHLYRKEQDDRRDNYLRSLGWKVIRIKMY